MIIELLTQEVHNFVLCLDYAKVLGIHGIHDLKHVPVGAVRHYEWVLHIRIFLDVKILVIIAIQLLLIDKYNAGFFMMPSISLCHSCNVAQSFKSERSEGHFISAFIMAEIARVVLL